MVLEQLALEPEIFLKACVEYLGLQLKKNLRKKEKNNLNRSKKFQLKNQYFRKKTYIRKKNFGILNLISLMIPNKKFIFGFISKHKKDKIKYFLNKIESFFLLDYDKIL